MVSISASLWSADLTNLATEIKRVERYVDSFHFDVGDGNYIYNLLFFPDLIKSLRSKTKLPFNIHLMVNNPEKYIKFFWGFADIISFHPKSTNEAKKLIRQIKRHKIKTGIIIKVDEKLEDFKDLIDKVDKITFMGTKLGVKGKSFDKRVLAKISNLKNYLNKNKFHTSIEVDGGIRKESVVIIATAGADSVVAGSLIFNKKYKKISNWIHSL